MAKRSISPADTALVEFRESAGLTPPPRTLSNAASRLVDLLDDYLRVLQIGWEIPPGFPADRFVPSVSFDRDREGPIVQYLVDLGFTGDARRMHEAMQRCYDIRDWRIMMPSPGDDKGWQQFQQRYVAPLKYEVARLQSVIYEARQLIIDAHSRGSGDPEPKLTDAAGEEAANNTATAKKPKRSTERGEADTKLIAALTKHHQYAEGGCMEWDPIGSNVLAEKAKVGQGSANRFFNKWFGSAKKAKDGYGNYRIACNGKDKLIAILKTMNGDMPRPGEVLFGREVPDEAENPDHQGGTHRKPRASELHRHDAC